MSEKYDVAIIGGGHNGLLAGALLGRAGKKVVILEKNSIVGGHCTTQEFPSMPGFKFNWGAVAPGMIMANPAMRELGIFDKYPLEWKHSDPVQTTLFPDGTFWYLRDKLEDTCAEIERVSGKADAEAWAEFVSEFAPLMQMVYGIAFDPMPSLEQMLDFIPKDEEGGLGLDDLARTLLMSCNQMLNERFESDYVKSQILKWADSNGGFGFNYCTSFYGFNCILTAGMNTLMGGSGRMTEVLGLAAKDEGCEIRLNAKVDEVIVEDGVATGVRLENGEMVNATVVMSNLDPKMLFTKHVKPEHLDHKFLQKIKGLRTDTSCCFEIHCAINELPDFTEKYPGIDNDKANKSWFMYCGTQDWIQRWQGERVLKQAPTDPLWLGLIPSTLDPSLAPEGKHTLTICCYVSGELEGTTWDAEKQGLADRILNRLYEIAPNMRHAIEHYEILTPDDYEKLVGSEHGNIFGVDHGGIAGMLMFRPTPELHDSSTPIKNLYLCGASQPPMGGVSGTGGINGANKVLEDWSAGLIA